MKTSLPSSSSGHVILLMLFFFSFFFLSWKTNSVFVTLGGLGAWVVRFLSAVLSAEEILARPAALRPLLNPSVWGGQRGGGSPNPPFSYHIHKSFEQKQEVPPHLWFGWAKKVLVRKLELSLRPLHEVLVCYWGHYCHRMRFASGLMLFLQLKPANRVTIFCHPDVIKENCWPGPQGFI